jgi:AhpD family alkylhydroperoxidase
MSAPRIAPGTRREIGVIATALARVAGRAVGTGPPNIFTTLARHRRLFWRWLWFAEALMPGGRLPRMDSELVILRVAHLCRCAYEASHHERLARAAGLTAEEIADTGKDPSATPWSPRRLALLRATDELHAARCISDATWAELQVHLNEVESIELCMLVGHYEMLAMTLNSIRVQPD